MAENMTVKNYNNIKYAILNFIGNLVSPSVKLGIKKLLNPCCTVTSTASWSCTAANTATLTLTLSRSTNLLGNGTYQVNVNRSGAVRTYTGNFTDGDTISIASVATPAGGGSVTITGNLLLPTDPDEDTGVFISLGSITSTAPNCT